VSLLPFVDFLINKAPPYSKYDATMSKFGLEINEFTSEGASVATLYAGAPVYYSNRSAIDLLGKSDIAIARNRTPPITKGHPFSEFFPGHNKYDFDYSVGLLRPDVVAQHLNLPGELESLSRWGYTKFCTIGGEQIFVRDDSENVNRLLLRECEK
jgi:hypothetical protein